MYKSLKNKKTEQFIKKMLLVSDKYGLINENDNILIALSGGADSVSLLCALCMIKEKYSLHIEAAHVNHSIREEADSDEEFCRELCVKNGILFHSVKLDIPRLSKENRLSEEACGRKERYKFFNEIISERSFKIATAHNKDDCAENFLINAVRGVFPKGIPPKRENIIRPLIEFEKTEIYEFLGEINQGFCEDKTNFEADYTRNKVRLELIPYINEKFDTNFTKAVYNSLDVSYFEDDFIKNEAEKFMKSGIKNENGCIYVNALEFSVLHIALKRRIVREIYYILKKDGFISFEHIENIIRHIKNAGGETKTMQLCGNVVCNISKKKLVFKENKSEAEEKAFEIKVMLNEKVFVPQLDKYICVNNIGKGKAFFSDSEDEEFILRTRRDGDRVFIKNVGHKKLKSLFIDKKIPKEKRDSLFICETGSEICFVDGVYERKYGKNKYYIYTEI